MAIEKHLVARVGDTGSLYFVAGADKFDGLYVDGEKQSPVSFMSFISDNGNVVPLKDNDYQKFLWSMDVDDPKWQQEFMLLLPQKDKKNPYNQKVDSSIRAMERVNKPKFFTKYINR